MSTLAQMQWSLGDAIVHREPAAVHGLLAGDPARAAARMMIHSNNHRVGLREALTAIYRVVGRLLGPACFELLARSYVETYPKTSGNLLDYGEFLGELISATDALAGLPYLADVARLEWMRHQVGRAADALPRQRLAHLEFASLDDAAAATLHLSLMPAAQLFSSRFPVLRIWQSNQVAQPAPVSLDEGGVSCLVVRDGGGVRVETLSEAEFVFLTGLDQQSACAAADTALAVDPRFDLATSLARWLNVLHYHYRRCAP